MGARAISVVVCALFAAACTSAQSPAPAPSKTGPPTIARGTSCESVILIDATNERDGIRLEREWIRNNYPGAKLVQQSLAECNGKAADIIDIETANGQKVKLFFDISKWLGKY